jgi:putative phosphoribosyl transferase
MNQPATVQIADGKASVEGLLEIPRDAIGLVLFAHGSGSSRHSPRNNYVAAVLREAGIATLLMDLLTPEEDNDYERRFDIGLLTRRLLAAAHWVATRPATRGLPLGLFGASTGAAAALEAAAALGQDIRAVVSRGGRPDLASRVALAAVTAPTLLLVGGRDTLVIDLNQRARLQLQCECLLRVVPGASHLFEEPGTMEAMAREAAEWFVRYLPRPA